MKENEILISLNRLTLFQINMMEKQVQYQMARLHFQRKDSGEKEYTYWANLNHQLSKILEIHNLRETIFGSEPGRELTEFNQSFRNLLEDDNPLKLLEDNYPEIQRSIRENKN